MLFDDETEQLSHSDPQALQHHLQLRINAMVQWLGDNKMVVAPTKTKLLISCSKELKAKIYQNINIELKIANNTIRSTPSEKLLGVIISDDLT